MSARVESAWPNFTNPGPSLSNASASATPASLVAVRDRTILSRNRQQRCIQLGSKVILPTCPSTPALPRCQAIAGTLSRAKIVCQSEGRINRASNRNGYRRCQQKGCAPLSGQSRHSQTYPPEFPAWKSPNGFGKVAVAFSIPCNKPSYKRQGIKGPGVIGALQGAAPDL